jgi:hypothetical protein
LLALLPAAAPLQAWLSRLFFGATVAFEVPLGALFAADAVGDGLAMTAAAILGKFLSGAWAAPLVTARGCGGRAFWVGWLQARRLGGPLLVQWRVHTQHAPPGLNGRWARR